MVENFIPYFGTRCNKQVILARIICYPKVTDDRIAYHKKKEIKMKIKARLILASLLIATSSLMAAEFNLDNAKSKAKDSLDKEIKVLESAKQCVESAKNKTEFEACRQKAKIDLKAVKSSK